MSDGFQRVLDHIRSIAGTEAEKGRLFERLMEEWPLEVAAFRRIVQVSVETDAGLPLHVFAPRVRRRHLQHEVRPLPLLPHLVAVRVWRCRPRMRGGRMHVGRQARYGTEAPCA